jgi:hypothetical protein
MDEPNNLDVLRVEAVREALELSMVHCSDVILDHHASEKTPLAV